MIATLIGLIVSIMLVFLFEYLDNTIKSIKDVEEKLKVPVLGMLPHLDLKNTPDKTPLDFSKSHPKSFFNESIKTVRTGVLLSSLDTKKKVIVVTSSIPGEGKSTTAMNLAASISELGKVLLIDGDMRRPTVGKAFGLEKSANGISECVTQSEKLTECMHQIDDGNLYVMPCGRIPPNPLELLSSNRFADTLAELSEHFEQIIIDSPPALVVSDALVLSSHASGVIYVVKADSTPYVMPQDGLKRIKKYNSHIIGGVLNEVTKGSKSGYGSYYGGNYHYSYGEV